MMTKKEWEEYHSEAIEIHVDELRNEIRKILENKQTSPITLPTSVFKGKMPRVANAAIAELRQAGWDVRQLYVDGMTYLELR
jgi:hypothetical protein